MDGIKGLKNLYGALFDITHVQGGEQTFAGQGRAQGLTAAHYAFFQLVGVCSESGPFTITANETGKIVWGGRNGAVLRQAVQFNGNTLWKVAIAHPDDELDAYVVIFDWPGSATRKFRGVEVSFSLQFERKVTVTDKDGNSTSQSMSVTVEYEAGKGWVPTPSRVRMK